MNKGIKTPLGKILSIGVPRDEASFLQKAFEAGHPRSMGMHLSEGIKEMLKRNFEGSQYDLSKGRLDYIRKWAHVQKSWHQQRKTAE